MDDINKQNQASNDLEGIDKKEEDKASKINLGSSLILDSNIDELIRKIREDAEAVDQLLNVNSPIDEAISDEKTSQMEDVQFEVPNIEPVLEELKKEQHTQFTSF